MIKRGELATPPELTIPPEPDSPSWTFTFRMTIRLVTAQGHLYMHGTHPTPACRMAYSETETYGCSGAGVGIVGNFNVSWAGISIQVASFSTDADESTLRVSGATSIGLLFSLINVLTDWPLGRYLQFG